MKRIPVPKGVPRMRMRKTVTLLPKKHLPFMPARRQTLAGLIRQLTRK